MASTSRRRLISYQPLSFLYKLFHICSVIARIPSWLLQYALFRPHPKWTLRQSLLVRILHELVYMDSMTETAQPLSLHPGKEKNRFLVIEPASAAFYKGPLEVEGIHPAAVGTTWYPRTDLHPRDRYSITSVILHLHGGAFIQGDGRTSQLSFLASTLLVHADVSCIFAPQYRLSCRPGSHPFPAALQDALTSYLYLIHDLGIPASHITLSGDSAGGNLAIALVRYLTFFGAELSIPLPDNVVLLSPWVSLVNSLASDARQQLNPHFKTDILPPSFVRWGAEAYSRLVPASDPYISSLGHPFATSVPIFVNFGSAELLQVDGKRWVEEMRGVQGGEVVIEYEEAAPHDTLLVGDMIDWKHSAEGVAAKIGVFIRVAR
ncbi:alpha/beta hydrolase fold-3 domain-containing protein [Pseudomassariella vexata]|uniref:Alpha/beta hydrolase fold-3 domain-containing protein n=1 Tax=Pseudomassariella vexata TaxID=1141098 RepID=A0A1Y2ECQ0_9PEZI|nr:alpha/beta hydrolase fold-3 domain-containing protein [Pseudomassariella vexata]ORY69016.1 alpha/beta hydrolase fold-3 domain-containing protein [Pseudomassariella vexata]